MKPLLFTLFFMLAWCSVATAQTRIISLSDTSGHGLSLAVLNRQYPPVETLFASQPKARQELRMRAIQQFNGFIREHNLAQKRVAFGLREYYEPTGEAATVLVDWLVPTPDSTKTQILEKLAQYYRTNRFPATASTRFRNQLMHVGNIPEKRTVRTGAGVLSTVEQARNTTRPDTVTKLYFNQLELQRIPEEVYRFPNLQELDLSRNRISSLPARLTADLPKLQRLSLLYNALPDDSVSFALNKHLLALNLQGNRLTYVPASVRQNRRLESLWIGNNKLKTADLRGLRRLTDLNLYNAGLAECPTSLTRLRQLKVLDLYYNTLTELPARLSRLRRLEQLAISHNRLRTLPDRLARLKRLQVLYAHHNQIGGLPDRFERFRSLRLLDLSYNYLSTTPPVLDRMYSLEELDLNSNNLQTLSPGLTNLPNLKKLYLRSNPIVDDKSRVGLFAQTIQQLEASKVEVFH